MQQPPPRKTPSLRHRRGPGRALGALLVGAAVSGVLLAACGDGSGGATPALPPGAVQNPDGTVTLADGTVTDPNNGMPTGTAAGPGAATPAPTTAAPGDTTAAPTTTVPGMDEPPGDDGVVDTSCSGDVVVAPKRMVRLTFNQIANSIRSLLGDEIADTISAQFEIGDPTQRTFPPLNSPREGSVIIDSQWNSGDGIAQAAAQYVFDNFEAVTGCTVPATAECGEAYALGFAEQAFRRPLRPDEQTRFLGVYSGVQAEGATIEEAVRFSVYAALSTPQFLYRTEFGADVNVEGALTQHEIASLISYFVTDGPPDQMLLDAAARGELVMPDQIGGQVDRLLETEEARINLQSAMYAYFGIPTLETIVIDPGVAPNFTEGLRNSMMREVELFLNDRLWSGPLSEILLSNESYVNEGLATLYGAPAPATTDADGFGLTTLPDTRSGLLTMAGYTTTRSSPERASVVRRGLLINESLLCGSNPAFPEELTEAVDAAIEETEELTERAKVTYRAETSPCNTCHLLFDAYGLSLESYDLIGAYRTMDEEGRPIDASVTLPPTAGGGMAEDASAMAEQLVSTGAFSTCVSKNVLAYALAEGAGLTARSCSTKAVVDALANTDQTFSSLVREVARSQTFTVRSAGGTQ